MNHSLPLFQDTELDKPFALQNGTFITHRQFQTAVLTVAQALPTGIPVMNMCSDRYWFTVGWFAAIAKGSLTVLPSSAAPEHLAMVASQHPNLLVLGDQSSAPLANHPWFQVNQAATGNMADITSDIPMISYEQQIACLYTSGSTGTPTKHYKTFGRFCLSAQGGAERLWHMAEGPCSIIATVPIRHMYGLEFTSLMPVLGRGCITAQTPFFPADIAEALQLMPTPRLLVISPFHLSKLLESGVEVPPISIILCATAPLPVELARGAEECYRCKVVEIYGSTETGQLATRRPATTDIWQTVNHITLEQQDNDIWAAGPVYESPQMLNDMVELLNPSSFKLIDRKANMINVAGKRSSLSQLNAIITNLPGVHDAAFYLPMQNKGKTVERLTAFVVAPGLTRENVIRGLQPQVDPVFLPRPIIFVDHLPRDGNGKLTAQALEDLLHQHQSK